MRFRSESCSWTWVFLVTGFGQVRIVFLVLAQVFRVLRFTARVGGRRTPYREWFFSVCVCLCMCLCLCVCVFLCPSLPDSVPPSFPLILPTIPPFRFDWNHRCRHTDTQTQTRDKDTDTQTHTHTLKNHSRYGVPELINSFFANLLFINGIAVLAYKCTLGFLDCLLIYRLFTNL